MLPCGYGDHVARRIDPHLVAGGPHRAENPAPKRAELPRYGALPGMGVGGFSSPFPVESDELRLKTNVRGGPLSALCSRSSSDRRAGRIAPIAVIAAGGTHRQGWVGAGADLIPLYVGQAAEHRQHQAPRCWCRCRPAVRPVNGMASTMRLTMPNRSKVLCARRSRRSAGRARVEAHAGRPARPAGLPACGYAGSFPGP
jgi:hypothetical protein